MTCFNEILFWSLEEWERFRRKYTSLYTKAAWDESDNWKSDAIKQ